MKISENCPCPNTQCRRHGNCLECRSFHARINSPVYCEKIKGRPGFGSGEVNLLDYAACAG